MRSESVQGTVFHVHGDDTDTFAILHQEIERKEFNEEIGVVAQRLTVESVQNGVTGTIGSGGASVGLTTFTELKRLSTKRSLVDFAFFSAGEGHTIVLELGS